MSTKVGVMSDTHGLLRPEIVEILKSCDFILHGGDVNNPETLETLRSIAPLYVVRGNNDGEWADKLPRRLAFSIEGVSFLMVHDRKTIAEAPPAADIVVYGHAHRYSAQRTGRQLWLNPGSCGKRRFRLPITMATLLIEKGQYQVEKIVVE